MRKAFGILVLAMLFIGMILSSAMIPAAAAASQVDVNNAIEKGLAYLNSTQSSNGEWSSSDYPVASTAMAVLAFENAPNSHYGWNATDPYSTTVQNGLNWLFSQASTVAISSSNSAGNPDTSGDGIGIGWYGDGPVSVYETPMVLMAIIASNAPTNVTTTGPANVTGRTYHSVAQDIVDWIAWAQNSVAADGQFEGGWRYTPQSGDSDNSNSQWPVIGLMAAELWGIKAPAWAQSELLKWTNTTQSLTGNYSTNSYYGAFDYLPEFGLYTPAETAAGILELTYCGVNDTDSRIVAAEGYLNRDWNPNGYSPWGFGFNWNIGDLYDMYSVMKACRLTSPIPTQFVANYNGTPGVEWYNGTGEYADALVTNQSADGHWNNWVSVDDADEVSNALATAWGTLILEYIPIVVRYNLTVTVVDANTLNPIVGAQVFAKGPETYNGTTGIGGIIVFNSIEASATGYQVNASMTGYFPSAIQIVPLTNDTEITIRLAPLTYTLTVHVVDANTGSSISAATVVAVGPQNLSGVTDGGTVVFDNTQAGSYNVTASKTGYTSASVNVTVAGNTEITIRLTPLTYTLTVHVVDANTGNSISGANVIVAGPRNVTGTTEGGIVVFSEMQAGTYNVTASMTKYVSASVSVILTGNTEITIRLTPSTSELVPPKIQWWILAIIIVLAVVGAGSAIFLIVGADRIRRKRKEKRNHWRALEAGFDT
jgi:hypothetical protein